MKHQLIEQGYIPLDKSWHIRMGVLDLLNNCEEDAIHFLEEREQLSDDLLALKEALSAWRLNKPINVGESGTLYRFFRFISWKLGLNKEFVLQGSLKQRKICDNKEIVNYSLKELLKLDNGTSQWASAAVLSGNQEKIPNPPYKLKLTYEAVSHWKRQKKKGKHWEPRYDETILGQAIAFIKLLKKQKASFIPEQAEDYCFARAFGFMTKEDGESRWPSLRGHESDRVLEMEKIMDYISRDDEIDSSDHRAVQAAAMLQRINGQNVKIKNKKAVNKSWPQFWRFLSQDI